MDDQSRQPSDASLGPGCLPRPTESQRPTGLGFGCTVQQSWSRWCHGGGTAFWRNRTARAFIRERTLHSGSAKERSALAGTAHPFKYANARYRDGHSQELRSRCALVGALTQRRRGDRMQPGAPIPLSDHAGKNTVCCAKYARQPPFSHT